MQQSSLEGVDPARATAIGMGVMSLMLTIVVRSPVTQILAPPSTRSFRVLIEHLLSGEMPNTRGCVVILTTVSNPWGDGSVPDCTLDEFDVVRFVCGSGTAGREAGRRS